MCYNIAYITFAHPLRGPPGGRLPKSTAWPGAVIIHLGRLPKSTASGPGRDKRGRRYVYTTSSRIALTTINIIALTTIDRIVLTTINRKVPRFP